jgi:tetratricopeptide (TPR) repeat protein
VACWLWRREGWRLAAFGIAWVGLFLLPVANLIPMMQYMAERFLYLPLAGFLLALGAMAFNLPRRGLVGVMSGLVILVWTSFSIDRVGYWKDEVELFVRSSLDNPGCVRLHENAVIAVFNLPQMRYYFALDPATHKLVVADKFDPEKAETVLRTLTNARNAFPTEHRITMALGIYCERRGEASNAIPLLELATRQGTERQGTNDPECWVELGKAYVAEKAFDRAQASYQTALELEATNRPALHAYADFCYERREFKLALPALQSLEKLEPTNVENTRRLREAQTAVQR